MGKIKNPILFSDFYEIKLEQFDNLGIFNPTLNVDTKLFIDPLLLKNSSNDLIKINAHTRLITYFEEIITILEASESNNDLPWREADRRMTFHEISGTCLGYSSATIKGSAFGKDLREKLLITAKQIISLGIKNPELFLLLPLFENDIGADRISDMTTNIIFPDLAELTMRISQKLFLPLENFEFKGKIYQLPRNQLVRKKTPIILIPKDILSKLPVASDWSEVADVTSKNSFIRINVSRYIGDIWQAKNRKDKAKIKQSLLSNRKALETLILALNESLLNSYDFNKDSEGLLKWRPLLKTIARDFPFKIEQPGKLDIDSVTDIVKKINEQFQFLIEHRGLSKLLWRDKGTPHHEHVSQMIYFAVADSYCKANNLDITPEANTGTGAVDFKFSQGYETRVLVEIKLSKNPNVVSGYENQLKIYAEAERTMRAFYILIDVGNMGRKDQQLVKIKNCHQGQGRPSSEIIFIDGLIQISASKK